MRRSPGFKHVEARPQRERRVTCICAPRSETHVRDGRYVLTVIHSATCPVSEEQGTIFENKDDGPVGVGPLLMGSRPIISTSLFRR